MNQGAARPKEKFFFDINIFDEKQEPDVPPPPTFSEQELAAEQQRSFSEGKRLGLKESTEAREQHIARVLESIAANVTTLFAAEAAREKSYEVESVRLCLAVFEKAFPLYLEKFGAEELKHHLEAVLKRHENQKQIQIHVAPDVAEGINAHLVKLRDKLPGLDFTVQPDETLTTGACRLSWADGGAVRNPALLAGEIESVLKDLLAATAAKGHDRV